MKHTNRTTAYLTERNHNHDQHSHRRSYPIGHHHNIFRRGADASWLARADSGAVWTANQEAVLVTSHSFAATEQSFIADVESMSWYPVAAVGDTDIETGMVKLGWTVVHAVHDGVIPSAVAAVVYRAFSKTGMSRDDALGIVQLALGDLTGSSSADPGTVL
jgi:hypothetical protein